MPKRKVPEEKIHPRGRLVNIEGKHYRVFTTSLQLVEAALSHKKRNRFPITMQELALLSGRRLDNVKRTISGLGRQGVPVEKIIDVRTRIPEGIMRLVVKAPPQIATGVGKASLLKTKKEIRLGPAETVVAEIATHRGALPRLAAHHRQAALKAENPYARAYHYYMAERYSRMPSKVPVSYLGRLALREPDKISAQLRSLERKGLDVRPFVQTGKVTAVSNREAIMRALAKRIGIFKTVDKMSLIPVLRNLPKGFVSFRDLRNEPELRQLGRRAIRHTIMNMEASGLLAKGVISKQAQDKERTGRILRILKDAAAQKQKLRIMDIVRIAGGTHAAVSGALNLLAGKGHNKLVSQVVLVRARRPKAKRA
ncbi:hypothetical protein HY546_01015 [archaeon]|nr:hypothetical protein [archaeon]